MLAIDGTVSRLALPAIGEDLGLGFASLQWVLGAYALAVASVILLGGALSDQLGQRRVLLSGVTLFSLASLGCAAAPSVGWLLAARALEGVGAALIAPVSLAILESAIRSPDRSRAIGVWAALSGVVGAAAPFLGGWLLQTTSVALGLRPRPGRRSDRGRLSPGGAFPCVPRLVLTGASTSAVQSSVSVRSGRCTSDSRRRLTTAS